MLCATFFSEEETEGAMRLRALVAVAVVMAAVASLAGADEAQHRGCFSVDVDYPPDFKDTIELNTVYRITQELFMEDLYHIGGCMLTLVIFDLVLAMHTKARWFVLHLIANTYVVATALPDVITTLRDPANSIRGENYSIWPAYWIAAIHTYHCVAFRNLTVDDWVHHIVFGGTICTVAVVFKCGTVLSLLAFFLSGLPGGLDYLMLALVKHKLLSKEAEKRYNARVMVWLRSPGCLLCAFCLYVAWRYRMIPTTPQQDLAAFSVALLCFVNGQYYMQVVVGNTHRKVENFSC